MHLTHFQIPCVFNAKGKGSWESHWFKNVLHATLRGLKFKGSFIA